MSVLDSSRVSISVSGDSNDMNVIINSNHATVSDNVPVLNNDALNALTVAGDGYVSSLEVLVATASGHVDLVVESINSLNANIDYNNVANGRQMALLKCPIFASDVSGMFKSGTCYPVKITDPNYIDLRDYLVKLLNGTTTTLSDISLVNWTVYDFVKILGENDYPNIGYSNGVSSTGVPVSNSLPVDKIVGSNFDTFYEKFSREFCVCYNGKCYCCCLPSLNCNWVGVWFPARTAYYVGGLGPASGIDNFNSNKSGLIDNFLNSDNSLELSGLLIDGSNGIINDASSSFSLFFGKTLSVETMNVTAKPNSLTFQEALIKLVTAICDNRFVTDEHGMPRWYLPETDVKLSKRFKFNDLSGNKEDYNLLQQFSKRCLGSDWCNPNDPFIDWAGCVYPTDISNIGVTRTVEDVSNSCLPLTVPLLDVFERFDYMYYFMHVCALAEDFCYWHKTDTSGNVYELSANKPLNNLTIYNSYLDEVVEITGPSLLQDQSSTSITRIPGNISSITTARTCCENKMWIGAMSNLAVTASLRNICGMQNALYQNKRLDIPIADIGTIDDSCGNKMSLGPWLVLFGTFIFESSEFITGLGPYFGVSSEITQAYMNTVVDPIYNNDHSLNKIQGQDVRELMKDLVPHTHNNLSLLLNGLSYDPVPSNFTYNPNATPSTQ